MYSSADILARLREGATPESIADEMANALNEAQNLLKEEEAKAVQQEKKEKELDELANTIAGLLNKYVAVESGVDVSESGVTGAEVRNLMCEFEPLLGLLKNFTVKVHKVPVDKNIKGQSPEAVFAKFFKELGL